MSEAVGSEPLLGTLVTVAKTEHWTGSGGHVRIYGWAAELHHQVCGPEIDNNNQTKETGQVNSEPLRHR